LFPKKPSQGFLVLVALAAAGYLLVTVPPQLAEGYEAAGGWSAWSGKLYVLVVGVGVGLLATLAAWGVWRLWGNTVWNRRVTDRRAKNPSQLSKHDLSAELGDNLKQSRDYAWGLDSKSALRAEVERAIAELESKREARKLEIVAFGTISSGKSSLLNALCGREAFASNVVGGTTTSEQSVPWPDSDQVALVDTPGLAEVRGEGRAAIAAEAAKDADLVLFVVDGPLKAYEHDLLEHLAVMEKRLVVCLNKEDWYDARQRDELLCQLREQTAGLTKPADVVAVRSRETTRPVVRVDADGVETHGEAIVPPDISPLADRLMTIVDREGGDLLLANLLMQSRGLVDEAKERVLATLDAEADRIIDRYMWAAGGAAAANPVPLLDLAIGSGILVKMSLDLAAVYKQRVDSETVVEMLAQLGKNLVAMLGASAAAPALGSAIGSLLKTVPGIGWIAGGLLQGVVQALVARWIGRVFKRYYRTEMQPPPGGLAELAREEWKVVTSADELRKLVTRGREKIGDSVTVSRSEPLRNKGTK
jgi:predicted GTPase